MRSFILFALVLLLVLPLRLAGQQVAYRLLLTDDSLNQALQLALERSQALQLRSSSGLDSLERSLAALDSLRRLRERLDRQPDSELYDSAPACALRSGDALEDRLLHALQKQNAALPGLGSLLDGLQRSAQARRQLEAWLLSANLPLETGGRLLGLELLRGEQLQELRDAWDLFTGLRAAAGSLRDPALWGGQP